MLELIPIISYVYVNVSDPITKKNRKKLRYFRFSPNLAHKKLIELANYTASLG